MKQRKPQQFTDPTTLPKVPQSLHSERYLLGALIIDHGLVETAAQLLAGETFFEPRHGLVFDRMVKLRSQGKTIEWPLFTDLVSAVEWAGWLDGCFRISDQAVKTLCGPIRDTYRRRCLMNAAFDCQEVAADTGTPFEQVVADLYTSLLRMDVGQESKLYLMSDVLKDALGKVETAQKSGKFPGVPTHIRKLNETIGGLRKATLVTLGARPGLGKTALATNIVDFLMGRGNRGLVVSCEMHREEIALRILSHESTVPGDMLINRPNQLPACALDHLRETLAAMKAETFMIIDDATVTSKQLFMLAAAARKKLGGLDLIVVDYVQILEGETRDYIRSKADYLAEVVKDLKRLAKRQEVPVLALAQINRDGDDRPLLKNFKDTGQLEQESDVAMLLYSEGDGEETEYFLDIQKNRNGQKGIIPLGYNPETMLFFGKDEVR